MPPEGSAGVDDGLKGFAASGGMAGCYQYCGVKDFSAPARPPGPVSTQSRLLTAGFRLQQNVFQRVCFWQATEAAGTIRVNCCNVGGPGMILAGLEIPKLLSQYWLPALAPAICYLSVHAQSAGTPPG
jgi:hypothetical protein